MTKRSEDAKPFRMMIDDLFHIKGRGVAVAGTVQQGTIKTGDSVEIVGLEKRLLVRRVGVTVTAPQFSDIDELLEYIHNNHDREILLLYDVNPDQIKPGMMIVALGS